MKTVKTAVKALQSYSPGTRSVTAFVATLFVFFSCLGMFAPNAEANKNVNVTFAGAAGGKVVASGAGGANTWTASGAFLTSNSTTGVLTASNNTANPAVCGIWNTPLQTGFTAGASANVVNYTLSGNDIGPQTVTFTALAISGQPAASQTKTYGQPVSFSVTATGGGTLTYQWKKGGTNIPGATSSTYAISSVQLGDAANYTVTVSDPCGNSVTSSVAALTVNKANLTVSGVTANDKTYDRTTTATLNTGSASLVGIVSGDTVTLNTASASGAFADASASPTAKTVTVSGLALGGASAGNYTLTQPTTSAKINAAGLTVSGITANNKTYDRTTAATLNTGSAALVGVVSGDTVTLNTASAAGAFADANASLTAKTVTVSGLTIGGAQAGNYSLTQPTTTAKINAAGLTVSGVTANDKAYDGTTTATLNTGSAALVGIVSGDTVTLNTASAAGSFADANASVTAKTVTVTGLALGGASSGNYTLTQPTTSAKINARAITVTADAKSKVYNTTDPALTYQITSGSLVAPDAFTGAISRVSGETVGSYAIQQNTLALGSNYALTYVGANLTISKATATVTLDAGSLNYIWDGSAKAATATTAPSGLSTSFTYNGSNSAPSDPGSYTVVATINDTNYQGSTSGTLQITDTTGPVLNLSTLSDGAVTSNVVLNVAGTATDPSGIKSITINGEAVSQKAGAFSAPIVLLQGSNTITVVATDQANNPTTVTRTITADSTAPLLTVTAPADNSATITNVIDVTGTINAGTLVNVKVNGGSAQAASITDQTFSAAALPLTAGTNTIEIIATDLTGKKNYAKRTVLSDGQGMSVQVTDPGMDNIIHNTSYDLKGSAADGAVVTVTANGQQYTPAVTAGAFDQPLSGLPTDSTTAVTVTATDGSHTTTVQRNIMVLSSSATLAASVATPQTIGTAVTFTAGVTGATGNYEYTFLLRTGTSWSTVKGYSADNTWQWSTGSQAAGTYTVLVYVRDAGTQAVVSSKSMDYTLVANPPAGGATLSASLASPQVKGPTITFTGGATSGSGSYEYQFFVQQSGGAWTRVKDYSTPGNSFDWNTAGLTAGTYNVQVQVRNAGSTAAYETSKTMSYTILASAPASGATLTPSLASPRTVGTTVTFTAGVTSGSGSYEYQFLLQKPGGSYQVVQPYLPAASPANQWTWNTTGLVAGNYNVVVYIRNAGSPLAVETSKGMTYSLK